LIYNIIGKKDDEQMAKRYSGYTAKTMGNRLVGAGAIFKNYNVETDTPATAIEKLLGATRGGGSFIAKPVLRPIEVDGVPGKVEGMQEIDSWDVSLDINLIEVTAETIKLALTSAEITTPTAPVNYKKIEGKSTISVDDYHDNITFIGTLSGFDLPVVIQIYNALSVDGLTAAFKDKDDMVIPVKFEGHYGEDDLNTPPFAIFIPFTPTGGGE
jgi:hypothetical protein